MYDKCGQYCLSFNMQDFQNARGEMNGVNLLQIDICYYDLMRKTLNISILPLLLNADAIS